MLPKPLTVLAASPTFVLLIAATLLVGLRDSMAEPFFILFAVEKAHLAPLPLGVLLTLRAVGAVSISMAFGVWLDRRPSLRPILIALLLGVCGYLLLTVTTAFAPLLLVAAVPLAANIAAFPQLFALAKGRLDLEGVGTTAERGIAVMRATFSMAWAIGPVLGALVVERFDYSGNFLVSASCGCGALMLLGLSGIRAARPTPSARAIDASARVAGGVGLAAAGFTLFSMAIVMGAVALPIVVTRDLHGTKSSVGLMASTCAVLEVPVMIAVAVRPALLGGFGGLVAGFVALVVYFVAVSIAPSVDVVLAAQVLRAVAIGFVTCIGISYMQNLMPGRAGAAAATFSNTGQIGALLAGLAAGEWATLFDYRSMFLACALVAALGLGLLSLGAKPVRLAQAST